MKQAEKHFFLRVRDALSEQINDKANELFAALNNFDATNLAIEDTYRNYFIDHHLGKRLFFSIQNSAHIIYQSVKKTSRPLAEINIVDYGAGLGTLYMLAGMLPFKRIIYNDYLPDWKNTARSICEALSIKINDYVTGDIDAVYAHAAKEGYVFDIIASRNVIEHIYSLPYFFKESYRHNPKAIIFSTTSANYHNPAMRLKHYFLHRKTEKEQYFGQRKDAISVQWPQATAQQLNDLTIKTRGMAREELSGAIKNYQENKPITPVPYLRSNTCDPLTGYWCEHLLTKDEYKTVITAAGYRAEYTAGYWDTHYNSILMNLLAKFLNRLIFLDKKAYPLSPFVNIVAFN